MFYFEHFLKAGGVRRVALVSIIRTTEETWVYETLRDEIVDVFPEAAVTVVDEASLPARSDLLVLPVMGDYQFPLHDVIYEQLEALERLVQLWQRAEHVVIYRARWREVEVVASGALHALLRRRRLEAVLIRACRRIPVVRALLRPRYPS